MICFLCRCHGQIDFGPDKLNQKKLNQKSSILEKSIQKTSRVNLELVKEKIAGKYPFVKKVKICDSACLDRDFSGMANQIQECDASKVLICSCSSRADNIRVGLKKQGVDAIVEIADIREACLWIHQKNHVLASKKAWHLIKMAIVGLAEQESSSFPNLKTENSVLIVGAGPAGLSAATALARSGIRVHLVEKNGQPGGMLNLIQNTGPSNQTPENFLLPYLSAIKTNPLITIHLSAKLISIKGDLGSFTAEMTIGEANVSVNAGAVILATGARAVLPHGLYRYRQLPGMISAMELEARLKKGLPMEGPVIFIQCVGLRDENHPYCSGICCPVTLKNAIQIKTDNPQTKVIVFHRDMMCPGAELEKYYRRARSLGINFIRFDANTPPSLLGKEKIESLECFDVSLGRKISIEAKMVVLSTGLAPHPDTKGVFGNIRLNTDSQHDQPQGFFNVKPLMNPVQTDVPGVYVCGSARWPVLADQAVVQGQAAAMKALSQLSTNPSDQGKSRFRQSKFAIARVTKGCSGCGNCVAACPFEACKLLSEGNKLESRVNPLRCTGCGTCVSVCPNNSIQLPEQTSRAIGAMLLTAFKENDLSHQTNPNL